MLTFSLPRKLLQERWCVPAYTAKHALASLVQSHRTRTLGAIAQIRSGTYIPEYIEKGTPYIRVDNIRDFQLNENPEDIVFVSRTSEKISERCFVEANDVLVARTGTLGKATLALEKQAGWVLSQHVTRLSFNEEVLPGFIACYLNSPIGRSQLIAGGFGSTRLELTHEALGAVSIIWVNKDSQRKINQAVTDGVRLNNFANSALKECVTELENLLSIETELKDHLSIFEVQTLKDSALWTPRYFQPKLKQPIEKLERDFECVPLGQIARIERGKGTRVQDYVRKGVPFVRTTSLTNFGIDPFPDHYATEETYAQYRQPVCEGDILYSIEGKIGMSAYILPEQRCVYKNHVERIRVNPSFDPIYIFLFLNTNIGKAQALRSVVVQATLPGMAHRLREILIPISRKGKAGERYNKTVEMLLQKARQAFMDKSSVSQKWAWAKEYLAAVIDEG